MSTSQGSHGPDQDGDAQVHEVGSAPPRDGFGGFLQELKRRNVYRVAAGYAVGAFATLEGADLVLPSLGVPAWVYPALVWVTLLGFPVSLILAWAFDVTPQGVRPDRGGRSRTPLIFKAGGILASLGIVSAGAYWYLQVRVDTVVASADPGVETAAAESVHPRSIAVLPFTSDPALQYLGDGLAEEILNSLSGVDQLQVAARSSSFKLRGEDAETVRDALGVAYVLDGRLRQSADSLRVDVAMASTADQVEIWRRRFEGSSLDVFAIQDSIARGVVEGLALSFSDGGATSEGVGTERPEAYTAYLRGRAAANQRTADGIAAGIRHYLQAVELDPEFSGAYAALALAYANQAVHLMELPGVAYPLARQAAETALELDPDAAEAYAAIANVRSDFEWDWAGAEDAYLKALAIRPEYALARQWYAQLLAMTARPDEAIQQAEAAVRGDRLSVVSHIALGVSYYMARRFDEALAQFSDASDRFPEAAAPLELMGWAYRELGRMDEAVAAHEEAVRAGQGLLAEGSLGLALAMAGRDDEARTLLSRLEAEDRHRPTLAIRIALVYGALGEADRAFEWLALGADRRDPWITFAGVDAAFDPVREDARFGELLQRLGLAPPASP